MYETTDLRARAYPADPHVQPVTVHDPGVAEALTALGREDWTPGEDWTLHALTHAGEVVALAALGASGPPDTAGIDLIGVLPRGAARASGLDCTRTCCIWPRRPSVRTWAAPKPTITPCAACLNATARGWCPRSWTSAPCRLCALTSPGAFA